MAAGSAADTPLSDHTSVATEAHRLTSSHPCRGGIRFLRQLSSTPDDCGCERAGSLRQLRPSNEGVGFLGIRSLLPALAESVCVSVALTSRASSHVSSRQLGHQPKLSVAPTRGEF
ncbi:MAG: hypothetical protein A07HR60_02443 [uncultured archaeon A07HR60]|nr:MAG: hypothetical protein A07HR60_02443 [uncultured archaeon A07HR60]